MSAPERPARDYTLQIISRTLAILRCFTASRPHWTLEQLHRELRINKTSLFRILKTLESEGWVTAVDGQYRLTGNVLELGQAFLGGMSVRDVADAHIKSLSAKTNQTVTLAVLEQLTVVYIAIERPQQEVGILGQIGQRFPAHATALGKALLAFGSRPELPAMLRETSLERLTHRTIVDPEQLLRHLTEIREAGYALDDEERGMGIRCIGAPLFDHTGQPVASVSLSGPIFYLTNEAIPRYTELLLECTRAISEELGYVPTRTRSASTEAESRQ